MIDFAALRGERPLPKPSSSVFEAARLEADAIRFHEQVFGEKPPGCILVSDRDFRSTHACTTPESATHYALGQLDVYLRVTLVSGKPKRGRGTAADTAALVALWLDVDVNGGPNGKGGTVTNGAQDRETAINFLSAIYRPTLLVVSG